jgi:hypothetical protein
MKTLILPCRRLDLNEYNVFWYLFKRILTWHIWLILNSEMTPLIGTSIRRLTPDHWMLGSSKICERVTRNPSNVIISWEDGESTFYLRERVEEDLLLPDDGLETGLVYEGDTSAAVWSIWTAFCKVKA